MESGQRTRSTTQAVPLEVVRDDETPTEIKAGRKRKLTPAIFEKIMAAIEAGGRVTPECRQHGISPVTLFMRVGRNPEEARRFAEAKQIRLAKWHEEWLGEMHEHAKRSPWATAWLLERNFPELYALREFVRPVANGSQLVGDKIPIDRLQEYGRLMLEFVQQNQAKAQGETQSFRHQKRPENRLPDRPEASKQSVRFLLGSHDASHNRKSSNRRSSVTLKELSQCSARRPTDDWKSIIF